MAISKAMRTALKALSYPSEIHVDKTIMLERKIDRLRGKMAVHASEYRTWDHKIWNGEHEIPIRIFSKTDAVSDDIILFLHGGGWVRGNIDSYTKTCSRIAGQTGWTVVSVDYRLAPEHRFPVGLEDCYQVARELFLNMRLMDTPVKTITLMGDSAGGNLAAALSLLAAQRGEFVPSAQILIYPATGNDHSENSPFASVRENGRDYLLTSKRISEYMNLYAGTGKDFLNPLFAPLLAEDLSGQPDTLIVTAEYCPLRDEGEAYGEKLRNFGCNVTVERVKDALHGYFSLPLRFSQVSKTFEVINEFLEKGASL